MKQLLFIAPLPPPITGQSVISGALLSELQSHYEIISLNYTRKDVKADSGPRLSQFTNIIKLSGIISRNRKRIDLVYFTISQSLFGNLKDLFFLWKMGKSLRLKTVIHLHGGHFHDYFAQAPFLVKMLNRRFFKDVACGIVLSDSLYKCLQPILPQDQIRVVPNFIDDSLLISSDCFIKKWSSSARIELLFLSNFIREKGYIELLDAFLSLSEMSRSRFRLHFAGKFEDIDAENEFTQKIRENPDIEYHGVVLGNEKKELYHQAHAFFLPSYYPIEGQPVSILEAYASGCIIVSTDQGGIPDIFSDETNGFEVEKRSAESLLAVLQRINKSTVTKLTDIARHNREYITNYTKEQFIQHIIDLLRAV